MLRLSGVVRSDVGHKRDLNEDSYYLDADLGLFVVADGMGGAASGEVASRLVAETVGDYLRHYLNQPPEADERYDYRNGALSPTANTLMQAIHLANDMVFDTAEKNQQHHGMGSTLALLMVDGDHVVIANVGDSRVFRMRNGTLERLTVDHRVVDDPKFRGMIDPEATIMNTLGTTLTRAMGVHPEIDPDVRRTPFEEGDLFLLCTDGLTDFVQEQMIARVLAMSRTMDQKASDLIELALAGGGRDNVTVILVGEEPAGGLKGLLHKLTK